MPNFIYVTCQIGAEPAVKTEIARRWPDFRFAFSKPGFLTFKLPENHGLAEDFDLESVFARAYGFSLGKISGDSSDQLVAGFWKSCKGFIAQRLHVWEKDRAIAGDHGYEPTITEAAVDAHRLLLQQCPFSHALSGDANDLVHPARAGEMILDCIMLAPGQWWAGYHRAALVPSRYPGGMVPLELPPDAVSRAWLKMEEALRWSQLPILRGARVAEIGSALGAQAKLCWPGACWSRESIRPRWRPRFSTIPVLPIFAVAARRCDAAISAKYAG